MIINREGFITEMAKRNGVTKKASREYTEMFLNTFFELLTEGHTIRFWRLFSALIITSAETNTSVNPNTAVNQHSSGTSRIVNIDYTKLNKAKKRIGDMGEDVVIMYETQRLKNSAHSDYADLIEHSSVIIGDGLGYDIVSYQEDGSKIYIEVKTTKQNKPNGIKLRAIKRS